jgi:MscS family membrane protein
VHSFFLHCVLFVVIVSSCTPHVAAQVPVLPGTDKAQPAPPVPEPKDTLGRDAPQSAVLNFMKYAHRADYQTAAKYLEHPTVKQNYDPLEMSRRLMVLINTSFHGSVAMLSNRPEGSLEDAEDPNTEVVGSFIVGDQTVPLVLVRVTRKGESPIWLVSHRTLDQVPGLYEKIGSPRLSAYFPDFLESHAFEGVPLAQWIAWFLAIPFSLLIGWALTRFGTWMWKLRNPSKVVQIQPHLIARPLTLIFAILVDMRLVLLIGMPILYRVYYFRGSAIVLTITGAWLCIRIADQLFERAHVRNLRRESQSLLQLVHRFNNVVIVIMASLLIASILGFDTRTMLAGLGIGGIALALAAQKTLENLIGGITLVMDKSASVGDDCVISGRIVTIQEIGLRSIRVRTLEGTEIAHPNGVLSQTSIENLSRRTRFLISTPIFLSFQCSLAQLQLVIARVRELLYSHPCIETKSARFRMSGVNANGFRIDLFAYVQANDAAEFTAIQEDVFFRIIAVVENAGAVWAPSQVTYLAKDSAAMDEKINEAAGAISRWQQANEVPFPDFSSERIEEMRGSLEYPAEGSALRRSPIDKAPSKEVA